MESASSKCHCNGLSKCVVMVLSSRNGQNIDCQSWSDQFSRYGRALGCVVEHDLWVERCLGGVSQHQVPLQWAE